MLALDFWSQRTAGYEPQGELQVFFAENFDDKMMANRFQTMMITQEAAVHAQIAETAGSEDANAGIEMNTSGNGSENSSSDETSI